MALALSPVGARPAAAHSCATPSLLTVGQPAAIIVGVAAESSAVDDVKIKVPPQLRLTGADQAQGWTLSRTATEVDYSSGRIEPLTCAYFTLRGVPTKRATFVVPFTLHFEDGTSRTFTGTELGALDSGHLVFAGTNPDAVPSSTSPMQIAVIVSVAAIGVTIAAVALRRALRPPGAEAA
ncbi:MAG: hypothetical protein QOF60_881 [Actinomycetota bacterium]|nr:hypothetical protein [Actinomycetota bacterium]